MDLTMFAPIYRGDQPMPTRWVGTDASEPTVEFGRFRVLLRRRQLLVDGVPVELGTRAFDVLLTLIEANGLLVTKEELLNRVWSDRIVEEGNLQVQVLALRKALGADRDLIRTEHGRGYRLIAAVRPIIATPSACLRMTRRGRRRDRKMAHRWRGCETAHPCRYPVSVATAGTVPVSSRPSDGNDESNDFDPRSRWQRRHPRATDRCS
jgi:DNA-binding winged helix-turn-helix (wHTH) protein